MWSMGWGGGSEHTPFMENSNNPRSIDTCTGKGHKPTGKQSYTCIPCSLIQPPHHPGVWGGGWGWGWFYKILVTRMLGLLSISLWWNTNVKWIHVCGGWCHGHRERWTLTALLSLHYKPALRLCSTPPCCDVHPVVINIKSKFNVTN